MTTVCTKCGFQNEPGDAFCGSCGSFLEWSGSTGDVTGTTTALSGEAEREVERATKAAEDASRSKADADRAVDRAQRLRREAEERAREEEKARRRAEASARREAEEAERLRREADDRAQRDAEARRASEAEARHQAEEAERLRRQAEERARREDDQRRLAEEQAQLAAGAEERRHAEEQARIASQEAQRLRREADERARQEADARWRAEKEAAARAEVEIRARSEEEARSRAEQEASRAAEEESRRRADAEAAAKAEADRRARDELEAKKLADREGVRSDEAAKRAAALVARAPAKQASKAPTAYAGPLPPPGRSGPPAATTQSHSTDVSPVEPGPPQPLAVRPGVPRERPSGVITKEPPSRQIRPGDLVCGQCGEGNDPARKFCRRCGESLAEAQLSPTPWHKRLFRRKPVAAGERPVRKGTVQTGRRVRRGFRGAVANVFKVAALLGVAGLLVGYVGPWRSAVNNKVEDAYRSVRRVIAPTYSQLRPTEALATTEAAGHPAAHAIDGLKNTYWSADSAQEHHVNPNFGAGEISQIIAVFGEPVDIDEIGFTLGASENPEDFVKQPRPKVIHVTFQPSNEGVDITLKDTVEFQRVPAKGRGVAHVELHVIEVYGAVKDGGTNPSIAEIEFYVKD